MSSRQEQKERRKQERLERERREKHAEQRKKLGQMVGAVAIVAAIVVGVILAASGGGSSSAETGAAVEGEAPDAIAPPPQRIADLETAVREAGCAFREFDSEGSDHVEDELTAEDYETNPPTSGRHNPVWATDGYYARGEQPALKNSVHALEHGRIQFQYSSRLPVEEERRLRGLFNEDIGGAGERYHSMMFQNNSNMTYMVAAVAWRSYVVCNEMNDGVFDAFRAFYRAKLDKAPEQVP